MFSDLFLLNPSFPCLGARGPDSVSDLRTRRLSGKASGLPSFRVAIRSSAVSLLPHLSLAASSCWAARGAASASCLPAPRPACDPEPDLNRKCVVPARSVLRPDPVIRGADLTTAPPGETAATSSDLCLPSCLRSSFADVRSASVKERGARQRKPSAK